MPLPTGDPGRLVDGSLSVEGGVESGLPPSLIQENQLAWAVNATMRGGFPKCRPGILLRPLAFDTNLQTPFQTGRFQGAGVYVQPVTGYVMLATAISGRLFTCNVSLNNFVSEFTIPGDPNDPSQIHGWFQQAENWLIYQDGTNRPVLWDGTVARRSVGGEVPVGGPMAYGKGRLWVAKDTAYVGGDLVGSDPALGPANVINFTENDFLNEGGAFQVGSSITGLAFGANIDTSLGQGDLLVFTANNIYAFDAPQDRTTWKDLTYPIQRFALLDFGSMNHESISRVNGDLFFRSQDGIRSFVYARREFTPSYANSFNAWGNIPISRPVKKGLEFDSPGLLLGASAVNFDNRYLATCLPQYDQNRGIYHLGLLALDFEIVSTLQSKSPPAWEGIWTGLKILRILTATVRGVQRCFIWALDKNNLITLWELSTTAAFDFDGTDDVPISWVMEDRATTFKNPNGIKAIMGCENWYDQFIGNLTVIVKYRTNEESCWVTWGGWQDCAKYRDCTPVVAPACQKPTNFRPISRARIGLGNPPPVPDQESGGYTREGYEFQVRYEITGHARFKRRAIVANAQPNAPYPNISRATCPDIVPIACGTGCQSVACCDQNDLAYSIQN